MTIPILVIGDGGSPTGYARVIESILIHLPREAFQIHHLAVNYFGDPHELPWRLYPASPGGDLYGVHRIKELVEAIAPELVFSVADLWTQELYLKALFACAKKPKIVLLSPVESEPIDPDWVRDFSKVDQVVTYTRFARQELLRALPEMNSKEIEIIPLGIDPAIFQPILDEDSGGVWDTRPAKRALNLFHDSELEDSFVVLNAHRNQPRKRIDLTIQGFSLFAREKPRNVKLFLHMGAQDAGWNIPKLASRYGIFDRLILTGSAGMPNVEPAQLNLIYNACDVGINTAMAEGWGLPNWEHAAAGKAQILPRLSNLQEIWEGSAEFIEPSGDYLFEKTLSVGKVISPEALAASLEALYQDRAQLKSLAEAGFRKLSQPENQWPAISMRWYNLFQEVLN